MQFPQRCSDLSSKPWKGNPHDEHRGGTTFRAFALLQHLSQTPQSCRLATGVLQMKHRSG